MIYLLSYIFFSYILNYVLMKIGIEWFEKSPFGEFYNTELAWFWIFSPLTILFGILFTIMCLVDLANPILRYIGSLISGHKGK